MVSRLHMYLLHMYFLVFMMAKILIFMMFRGRSYITMTRRGRYVILEMSTVQFADFGIGTHLPISTCGNLVSSG